MSIILNIYVQPGAKKSEIVGKHSGRLKIRVKAAPIDGKANDAVIAFFAELLNLRKQDITIIHGTRSRFKTLSILKTTVVMEKLNALGIQLVEDGVNIHVK